jgi:ornithine carbamoyltransferase
MNRHFLRFRDLPPAEISPLLYRAIELKSGAESRALEGKSVALMFEKPSLRTKLSFWIGAQKLGANPVYFSPEEVGLGKREPVADVAKVVASMADMAVVRTFAQATLDEFGANSEIPVINALTDGEHPCQALADAMTMLEIRGYLDEVRVAFIGDGNNVAASLAYAIAGLGGTIVIASPFGYELQYGTRVDAANFTSGLAKMVSVIQMRDPIEATRHADFVYTDVWTSMGQEAETTQRLKDFQGYQVNPELMEKAKPQARFMHDMPAHPGEEVSEDMLSHPSSVVYQQAENRMWAQMALMEHIVAS